jgi:nucleotide-binding universal stress UspA family protein
VIIRSVVCAVDFSAESRTLVRAALAIALQEDAIVSVVHVLDPLLAPGLEQEAYTALDTLIAGAVEGSGLDPRSVLRRVRCGETDAEILAAAAEFYADLIVIGTEALRDERRPFFGSVAARVLAQTEVPVLAIPPFARDPIRHMLVAVDVSDTTMMVVREAADLARRWGASLTLLNVVPESSNVLVGREIAGVPVPVLTVSGAPEDTITRVAGEQGSSLVALGLRRPRQGWFAPRPGSTACRVLSMTNVPILVAARLAG